MSVEKYNEAANILIEIGFNKRATMAYLGAAWASAMDDNKPQACEYYQKSAATYKKPSVNKEDTMSPQLDSENKPFSKSLAEFKTKDGCK